MALRCNRKRLKWKSWMESTILSLPYHLETLHSCFNSPLAFLLVNALLIKTLMDSGSTLCCYVCNFGRWAFSENLRFENLGCRLNQIWIIFADQKESLRQRILKLILMSNSILPRLLILNHSQNERLSDLVVHVLKRVVVVGLGKSFDLRDNLLIFLSCLVR